MVGKSVISKHTVTYKLALIVRCIHGQVLQSSKRFGADIVDHGVSR